MNLSQINNLLPVEIKLFLCVVMFFVCLRIAIQQSPAKNFWFYLHSTLTAVYTFGVIHNLTLL